MVVVVVVVDGGEGGEMIRRGKAIDEEKELGEETKRPVGCGSSKAEHSSSVYTNVVQVDRRICSMLVSRARRVVRRRGLVIVPTMEGVTVSQGPRRIRRIKCKEECM